MSEVKHLGIILDGNRRFAKKLMLEPWKGHELGANKIEKLFDWCKELGIKQATLYCLSLENFDRPKNELDFLMNLFKKEFRKILDDERVMDDGIRINFIGLREKLDANLQDIMSLLETKTRENKNFIFNFAIAYGGKREIIDAVSKVLDSGEKISEESIEKNLWLKDKPDLIIRTGGETRTSNFLIWQAAYSEWIFLDKMWPEFERADLVRCIEEFKSRERRFGK